MCVAVGCARGRGLGLGLHGRHCVAVQRCHATAANPDPNPRVRPSPSPSPLPSPSPSPSPSLLREEARRTLAPPHAGTTSGGGRGTSRKLRGCRAVSPAFPVPTAACDAVWRSRGWRHTRNWRPSPAHRPPSAGSAGATACCCGGSGSAFPPSPASALCTVTATCSAGLAVTAAAGGATRCGDGCDAARIVVRAAVGRRRFPRQPLLRFHGNSHFVACTRMRHRRGGRPHQRGSHSVKPQAQRRRPRALYWGRSGWHNRRQRRTQAEWTGSGARRASGCASLSRPLLRHSRGSGVVAARLCATFHWRISCHVTPRCDPRSDG